MNILKFFRWQGFKKVPKKYFAQESFAYSVEHRECWSEYNGLREDLSKIWFEIKEVSKREAEGYRRTARLLFDPVRHNCLSLQLNEKEIVYIFCNNQMSYSILMINNEDGIFTRAYEFMLEDHGTENSFNKNLKSVIGTTRYRDYVLTQIFKKEEKV